MLVINYQVVSLSFYFMSSVPVASYRLYGLSAHCYLLLLFTPKKYDIQIQVNYKCIFPQPKDF